ncbi:ESX-1 secretion-associated protein [Mycolicibacterium austroafricanum]|uniref:ESX-1 secretion-associated protein n=1 Tax=Mycolicibacterium austroafricanum TaxID=39687 RepID=UPI00055B0D97|nr:ESX-1 secretion-associated protein [Mycolicibacterium austroafricanum]QZY46766.1 ESX-1 secretion-associated protein [Mycolicibacterium austroafricanum]
MTTPGEQLHVEPSHLRRLSARQSTAAAQIADAIPLTADEAGQVLRSHGIVCMPTYLAAQAVLLARAKAGIAVQVMSEAFAANLDTAAANYSWTDQDSGSNIDGKMRPGRR